MVDLSEPIRDAIIGAPAIANLLAQWNGEPAVFTRRPVPPDAPYPMCAISPNVAATDADWIVTRKPLIQRDIIFYAEADPWGEGVALVMQAHYLARRLFHDNRFCISVPGFHLIETTVTAPINGPVDNPAEHVARGISVLFHLQDLS